MSLSSLLDTRTHQVIGSCVPSPPRQRTRREMPYKNPEDKSRWQAEWKRRYHEVGYGKALYAQRKKRWDNEKILRQGIEDALAKLRPVRHKHIDIDTAIVMLELTLQEAPVAKTPMKLMKEDL